MEDTKKHILSFYEELKFNDEHHQYSINGKRIKFSVSGLIKKFVKPFDSKRISKIVARARKVPQKVIIKEWNTKRDRACRRGTEVHLFGELYPFNKQLEPKNGYEEAVVKFWNDLPSYVIPVFVELQMYHKEYMFAGTADIILYNTKTGNYIIGDYKTNEDLFKNYKGKKMVDPFGFLLDNSFNKYQLQLSFYQILFEQLDLKVSSRKIIWLLSNGEYKLYDTEDYTKVLENYLKNESVC